MNVYMQVLDGAMRTAVDKIGDELFKGREEPAASPRQMLRRKWRALQDSSTLGASRRRAAA